MQQQTASTRRAIGTNQMRASVAAGPHYARWFGFLLSGLATDPLLASPPLRAGEHLPCGVLLTRGSLRNPAPAWLAPELRGSLRTPCPCFRFALLALSHLSTWAKPSLQVFDFSRNFLFRPCKKALMIG
jgi:hypothetical protein